MPSCVSGLLAIGLLAAALGPCQGRGLQQEMAPAVELGGRMVTKVGYWRDEPEPLKSFDAAIVQRIGELAGLQFEMVPLFTLDDRIEALQNGTVDWVVAGFTVTPQRTKLVDFVLPYYYSSGTALFAPEGNPAGITRWEDVSGKKIAALTGYYANQVVQNYGAQLVLGDTLEELAKLVTSGQAVAYLDDSTDLKPPGGLQIVKGLPILLPTPYGVAVKKGNKALADKISAALRQMVTGGDSSDLAKLEQQYFISAGGEKNPDLQALLKNPSNTTISLGSDRSKGA